MSQAATMMSSTLAQTTIARLNFLILPGQGLLPVDSQPRQLQSEQR